MAEPAKQSKAVIDRDDNDLLLDGEMATIMEIAASTHVAAAVYPHHDRQAAGITVRVFRHRGRPDVDVQAILAAHRLAVERWIDVEQWMAKLGTDGRELPGVQCAGEAFWRARRLPAKLTDGRLRIRDSTPTQCAIFIDLSANCSGNGLP